MAGIARWFGLSLSLSCLCSSPFVRLAGSVVPLSFVAVCLLASVAAAALLVVRSCPRACRAVAVAV
jgi:hypothetical protein